jgi:hypothetical protein
MPLRQDGHSSERGARWARHNPFQNRA